MADQVRACTFFGHRDTPEEIRSILRNTLYRIILEEGITTFYVGNQGRFDSMVKSELLELKKEYELICVIVVFAYFPQGNLERELEGAESIYPDGIESVPKQFCISWRNKWMVQHSDMVITYITRSFGGASQFADYAKKKGKVVINLAAGKRK